MNEIVASYELCCVIDRKPGGWFSPVPGDDLLEGAYSTSRSPPVDS
jgi:hypothetical protein